MNRQHYEDGQQVKLKYTGEIVTIDKWSISRGTRNITRYTYTVKERPGTFYFHDEFEGLEGGYE